MKKYKMGVIPDRSIAVMSRLLALAAFSVAFLSVSLAEAAPCANFPCSSPFFHAPYTPANLLKTYQRVRSAYSSTEQNWQVMENIIWPLEDAGVQILLTGDGGVTSGQRIQILNDYGFWLYRQGNTAADAVAVLQTVVKLDPQRAVAWLNLGDAYVLALGVHDNPFFHDSSEATLPPRLTWADGQALNRKAINAYQHYLTLGGAPSQHVRDFLALNQLNAPQGDVCAFITAYADAGRLNELGISGNGPIDLVGGGSRYYVYNIANGTGHVPDLLAFISRQKDVEDDYVGQDGADTDIFSGLPEEADDGLFLIAFKSGYYALELSYSDANDAVYTAPHNGLPTVSEKAVAKITIVQPNHGVICTIPPRSKRSWLRIQTPSSAATSFRAPRSINRIRTRRCPTKTSSWAPGDWVQTTT